jgi:hypothetical protein
MSLNIALVTNSSPRHKHFVVELNKKLNVKCVLIVSPTNRSTKSKTIERIKKYGFIWFTLKVLSRFYKKWNKASYENLLKESEKVFFGSSIKEFDLVKTHQIETVNNQETIDLIVNNQIDVICFLGGDIAKKNFIESAKIACLNIHSGLSPFYNGSSSASWTFADFRPNFSGVTLMRMNERIDGGDIISHYLPEITPEDDASTLFCKGIVGGIELILDEIENINNGASFTGITQSRSFKYTRGMDWTIYHDLKLKFFHESGRIKLYNRKGMKFNYRDVVDNDFPFSKTLSFILNTEER